MDFGFWIRLRRYPLAALALCALLPALAAGETNLVRNGAFEEADGPQPGQPACWDQPDGLGVKWVEAPVDEGEPKRSRAIRMDTAVSEKAMVAQWRQAGITNWDIPKAADNAVAETYGLSFYSDAIPVVTGQAYRVTFDFKGASGGAKVWVRGWGQFQRERRRRYETIVNCRVPDGKWHTLSQVFYPTKLRPEVTEMKVMLYAYYPPGIYWFDNVRIEPISAETYEQEKGESRR